MHGETRSQGHSIQHKPSNAPHPTAVAQTTISCSREPGRSVGQCVGLVCRSGESVGRVGRSVGSACSALSALFR
eukprot:14158348-Alexandrium_andersonii.AAC.1